MTLPGSEERTAIDPASPAPNPPPKRRRRLSPAWSVLAALALVALMVGLRFAVELGPSVAPLLILFIIPITISAVIGGYAGGLAATLASAVVTAWVFLPPGGLWIETGEHLDNWVGLCVGGTIISIASGSLDRARRRAEEHERALHESVERLGMFIEHAPAAVALFDREMRYIAASRRYLVDYRLGAIDLRGRSHYDVFPEIPAAWRAIHQRCLAGAIERSEAESFPRADGTTDWVRWEIRPWRDATGAVGGIAFFSEIVTEQKRLTEQLQHAQKLESVARLAGGVAHDFNNLLTVILTCSETLKDDLDHGAPASAEDIEAIRTAAERARDLTRQLLAFARRQIVAPVALDVNGLLRGSQKMIGRLLGEDVELRLELAPELWTTVADPGQVEQVLLNLCVNARDAMPRGGTITIATRNVAVDDLQAAGGDELLAGEWVELSVRDTGVGMTAEVKAHLFEPFFTTKEQGKGTGLGLASIYGIVRQAGGHMHVESEPGRGATFTVHLPRTVKVVHEPRARSPGRAEGGSETILVAEDEAPVRLIITRALQGAGYRVLAAESGKAALGLAAAERGPIHLVLTDVVMPELDGRGLVEELQKLRSGFQVLYMSGYTHDIIGHHGVLDSGTELLAKPFTAVVLLERVRAILDAAARG